MSWEDRVTILEAQQALLTDGLQHMLQGQWVGFPSLEADLGALAPGRPLAPHPPRRHSQGPAQADCWQFWDCPTMAAAVESAEEVVGANWPALHQALAERGIATREVCGAVLATMAVETARTFQPVQEAFWLDDAWRAANLRYYPYHGRGYVQLTWDYNYTAAGDALGVDLINNPDQAMDSTVAAGVMAWYFDTHSCAESANAQDWGEVRRKVQGAHAGLDHLLEVLRRLGFEC
jgi:predicted chitinase